MTVNTVEAASGREVETGSVASGGDAGGAPVQAALPARQAPPAPAAREAARATPAAPVRTASPARPAGAAAGPESLLRRAARRWFEGWTAFVAEERPDTVLPPEERGSGALPYTKLAGFR